MRFISRQSPKLLPLPHFGLYRLVMVVLTLNFCHVKGQDVPIAVYQLKYWVNPYEYPIGGIHLDKTSKKLKKFIAENYVAPVLNSGNDDVTFFPQWGYDSIRCIPKTFKISPFYIQKTEVTNAQYQRFLADSNSRFFTENKITPKWVHPDTNVWLSNNTYMLPFVSYYYQHQAYAQYPVVGVSQYQATQYCNWLEIQLNQIYEKSLPEGYKIMVDLPTQAEFTKSVHATLIESASGTKWVGDPVKKWVQNHLGEINMGPIKTLRMADLYDKNSKGFYIMSTDGNTNQVRHLLGNAAEWTSTAAKGKLFNNLEYVYTMSERLIPNPDITATKEQLAPYLHLDSDLKSHFMVKGGSWNDEFHYIDPSAVLFQRGDYKAAHIGFRTVIRVVAKD